MIETAFRLGPSLTGPMAADPDFGVIVGSLRTVDPQESAPATPRRNVGNSQAFVRSVTESSMFFSSYTIAHGLSTTHGIHVRGAFNG